MTRAERASDAMCECDRLKRAERAFEWRCAKSAMCYGPDMIPYADYTPLTFHDAARR
jgi:hypothetical protein